MFDNNCAVENRVSQSNKSENFLFFYKKLEIVKASVFKCCNNIIFCTISCRIKLHFVTFKSIKIIQNVYTVTSQLKWGFYVLNKYIYGFIKKCHCWLKIFNSKWNSLLQKDLHFKVCPTYMMIIIKNSKWNVVFFKHSLTFIRTSNLILKTLIKMVLGFEKCGLPFFSS